MNKTHILSENLSAVLHGHIQWLNEMDSFKSFKVDLCWVKNTWYYSFSALFHSRMVLFMYQRCKRIKMSLASYTSHMSHHPPSSQKQTEVVCFDWFFRKAHVGRIWRGGSTWWILVFFKWILYFRPHNSLLLNLVGLQVTKYTKTRSIFIELFLKIQ